MALVLICLATPSGAVAAEDTLAGDMRALASAQAYVGAWRGVGQPKRGSSQGAWSERAAWAWRFHQGRAALAAQLTGNKFYSSLELRPGDKPGELLLLATAAGGPIDANAQAPQRFTGRRADGAWVFTADEPAADWPARISLRLVAGGDRMTMLYERRLGEGNYARLAEVGATRQGSAFARGAASGPECVVTGGLGTIPVEHEGRKYFVCCGGCRDYFLENPAAALAEYRQRKADEQAESKK